MKILNYFLAYLAAVLLPPFFPFIAALIARGEGDNFYYVNEGSRLRRALCRMEIYSYYNYLRYWDIYSVYSIYHHSPNSRPARTFQIISWVLLVPIWGWIVFHLIRFPFWLLNKEEREAKRREWMESCNI